MYPEDIEFLKIRPIAEIPTTMGYRIVVPN
jgi:hypothetical protein